MRPPADPGAGGTVPPLAPDPPDPADHLAADEAVDHGSPVVRSLADRLRATCGDGPEYARAAFLHVRDRITHSRDARDRRVTWRASDVLRFGTGLCHAKSQALVALLRAAGIPAGLCYQRLGRDDGTGHVVHGLVALHHADRWVRLDPRGNRPGVRAEFSLHVERLAYRVRPELGEVDYPTVHARPHPAVLAALRAHDDALELCEHHLPDRL